MIKTFQQFVTEQGQQPLVRSLVRSLLEHGINPVRYVYFTLFEGLEPAVAASAAGPLPTPGPLPKDVDTFQKGVNDQLQQWMTQWGKGASPELSKLLASMQKTLDQEMGQIKQQTAAVAPPATPATGDPMATDTSTDVTTATAPATPKKRAPRKPKAEAPAETPAPPGSLF